MSSVTYAAETGNTGLQMPLRLPLRRVLAIDAFRGLTILVMIFVNTLNTVDGMPSWLYHMPEDADGMTLPDLVFPAFLFIVGMSIPFAISRRLAAGDNIVQLSGHVLMRTLGLLVLGVFMVNSEEGYNETAMPISIGLWSLLFYLSALLVWGIYRFENRVLAAGLRAAGVGGLITLALIFHGGDDGSVKLSPQWWGILGLIGWSYLFASAIYILGRGRMLPLALGVALLLLYYCLVQTDIVQSSSALQLLGFEAENAAHTAIVLCGVITALLFFHEGAKAMPRRFGLAAILALALFVVAAFLQPYYGISKSEATPSWALYSSALCVAAFAFFYWLIDLKGARGWTAFLRPAAANPLFVYMLPNIIAAAMKSMNIELPEPLTEGAPGLIWAVFTALAVLAVAHRLKFKLSL